MALLACHHCCKEHTRAWQWGIQTSIKLLHTYNTYIHTYIHTYKRTYIQAQPQTKVIPAAAMPMKLCASC